MLYIGYSNLYALVSQTCCLCTFTSPVSTPSTFTNGSICNDLLIYLQVKESSVSEKEKETAQKFSENQSEKLSSLNVILLFCFSEKWVSLCRRSFPLQYSCKLLLHWCSRRKSRQCVFYLTPTSCLFVSSLDSMNHVWPKFILQIYWGKTLEVFGN